MNTCYTTRELIKGALISNAQARVLDICIDPCQIMDSYVVFLRSSSTKKSIGTIRLEFLSGHTVRAFFVGEDKIATADTHNDRFNYHYVELDKMLNHLKTWFDMMRKINY